MRKFLEDTSTQPLVTESSDMRDPDASNTMLVQTRQGEDERGAVLLSTSGHFYFFFMNFLPLKSMKVNSLNQLQS